MTIALFCDTYPPYINGVSTSCYNLTNTLRAHGHRVIVITPRVDEGKFEYKDDFIYLPGTEMKFMYGYRWIHILDTKVYEVLKNEHIDVAHIQTDASVGIMARLTVSRLKIPYVYTYHTNYEDYTYYVTKGVLDRMAKRIVRKYSNGIIKRAAEFITPSDKTKVFMRNIANDSYINVIPTGFDFSVFQKTDGYAEKITQFRKEFGFEEDTKIILLLGRVAKEKSMDVSIKNFAMYIKKRPEQKLKMVVVGNGPQRSELELLVHELRIANDVVFLGAKLADEVPFYYHLADVYTSASLTETQGLTFMEAMASGTIVLARYDDNLSDTIIDNTTGFFFTDEYSFEEKLDRIFNMSDEVKQQVRENAYKIMEKYSIELFYQNIIKVYKRAIRKRW